MTKYLFLLLITCCSCTSYNIGQLISSNGLQEVLQQLHENEETITVRNDLFDDLSVPIEGWGTLPTNHTYIRAKICIITNEDKRVCEIVENKDFRYFVSGRCTAVKTRTLQTQLEAHTQLTEVRETLNRIFSTTCDFTTGNRSRLKDAEILAMYCIFSKQLEGCLEGEIKNIQCSNIVGIQIVLNSSTAPCESCDKFLKEVSSNPNYNNKLQIFLKAKKQYGESDGGLGNKFLANTVYVYQNGVRK